MKRLINRKDMVNTVCSVSGAGENGGFPDRPIPTYRSVKGQG